MAQKEVTIDGIGTVLLQRRKGTKHLRLSVRANGQLRVSVPTWIPYKAAEAFVVSQQTWIAEHKPAAEQGGLLPHGMSVGKYHHLLFTESDRASRVSTRLVGSEARVIHPVGMLYRDEVVQAAAVRVAEKALRTEAEQLLPRRLAELAHKHGFSYSSVAIKRLHTRWGSCSSRQEIVLNSMLMQLPWQLIDYVLLHELLHTRMMRHGTPFWTELSEFVSQLPDVRAQMKTHSPSVLAPRIVANTPTN